MDHENITENRITATYSPEDNKLRIYSDERLDTATYNRLKENGFKWAPKQKLFVAPRWTVAREDLCLELAGSIEPEEMSIAERAELKAARLDEAIKKNIQKADAFTIAADRLAERFHMGQPILVGHHSEKAARRDQKKIEGAMSNAASCINTAKYLADKAYGAECHANYKNRSDVRERRIKTLLAELRDVQRTINHGYAVKKTWEIIKNTEDFEKRKNATIYYAGVFSEEGRYSPVDTYDKLKKGMDHNEAIQASLEYADRLINNPNQYRWIEHILNRLSYERSELGDTKRYDGELSKVIIQAFARENGAFKSEAVKTEKGYILKSVVPLPMHIADGEEIELTDDEWKDLMQSAGYEVPEKTASGKSDKPPLLNIDVAAIKYINFSGKEDKFDVVGITKKQFSDMHNDSKYVRKSMCGSFRFRVGRDPGNERGEYRRVAFFITDMKAHDIPDSQSIVRK